MTMIAPTTAHQQRHFRLLTSDRIRALRELDERQDALAETLNTAFALGQIAAIDADYAAHQLIACVQLLGRAMRPGPALTLATTAALQTVADLQYAAHIAAIPTPRGRREQLRALRLARRHLAVFDRALN